MKPRRLVNIIPGLCECGCGQPTPPYKRTQTRTGQVKGAPMRFLADHNGRNRLDHGGSARYRRTMVGGTLRKIHQLRAEAALGKALPPKAVVHHHYKGAFDNDSPLVICENQAYHMLLHHRQRIIRAGGNPNTEMICGRCKQMKALTAFPFCRKRVRGHDPTCRECHALKPTRKERQEARDAAKAA